MPSEEKYFDLHTTGVGYLNRARDVDVQGGKSFLAAEISALRGNTKNVEYTRFDCRVSGKQAQEIVRRLMPEVEAERKVLIGFKLGDVYAKPFTYKNGDKAGQQGVSLKTRLLKVRWVKVDGETFALGDEEQTA